MIRNIAKLTMSIVLVLAGILFLLKEFGIINTDIGRFWPVILIVIGLVMFYEYFADRKKPAEGLFG